MSAPAKTYTFANSTTADASQVNQNFDDAFNGMTDGTKDLTIGSVSVAGNVSVGTTLHTSGISTVVATNGGSSTIGASTTVVRLAPASSISTYTLTLPASPSTGRRIDITCSTGSIYTLTLAANSGHTIASGHGVTSIAPGETISLYYDTTVWYRLGYNGPNTNGAINTIINGNFDVSQRAATFTSPADGASILDMWKFRKTGAMDVTITQNLNVPTAAESGFASLYSLDVDVTTADASVAATDYCLVRYMMPGYDYANLAKNTATLSFWVYATKTGTYCVSFRLGDLSYSYVMEYTVNTTLTWEKKVLRVPFTQAATSDEFDTGLGLEVNFTLMAGSNFQQTANAWDATGGYATSNQVNAMDSTSNDFNLAQVMLVKGTDVLPFVRYGQGLEGELTACKRFYEKSYNMDVAVGTASLAGAYTGVAVATNNGVATVKLEVEKNTTPTITAYSTSTGTSGKFRDLTGGSDVNANAASSIGYGSFYIGAAVSTGNGFAFHWVADASL